MIGVILFGSDGLFTLFLCVCNILLGLLEMLKKNLFPLKFFISHLPSVFDPFNMTFFIYINT